MTPLLTPEHAQLFSTQHLQDAADQPDDVRPTRREAVLSRIARYELRRRACQVPVRHRYESINVPATAH